MAVIVQVVIQADASGVMFTRPPPGTDKHVWAPDERLVNATLGLGAPVVNGAVSPDMLTMSSNGTVRSYTVAPKEQALVIGKQGPEFVRVGQEKASAPALRPVDIERLASLAECLERVEDVAHDVEFAVEQDKLFVVQARPVVGTGFPEGGDAETVWSRANVGEALPGVATPLTWSIARGFSERGFRQAFSSLGCTVPEHVTLVGNVYGRFYLNLTAFMRIAAQVPGLSPTTFLKVGGGQGPQLLDQQVKGISKKTFWTRLPLTASRLIVEQLLLSQRVDRFDKQARKRLRKERKQNLSELTDEELAAQLQNATAVLDTTGTLMLACASASLASYLALKTWLGWIAPDRAESLAQTLTAGVDNLESAKPGLAIAKLAALARQQDIVARGFVEGHYRTLDDVPRGALRDGLEKFFEEYGDRAVREPELATPRWKEDHAPVFSMLAAAIQNPAAHPEDAPARARARALRELIDLEQRLSRSQMSALRPLIDHARHTTRLRERMRAWVTRTLGAIRRLALQADQRLTNRHPDLLANSVFFCTCDELVQALSDRGVNLAHAVNLRRAEVTRDEQRPDPPVTFVGRPPPVVLPPAPHSSLRGLPASEGVVEGRVRVLPVGQELAQSIKPGEIIVARTTDVGLTPLFLLAAGVVTELGGPLSHAALVAREYGVPAVVNVTGATVALRSGDYVRLDGTRGIVERLTPRE